ncbi:MAG: HNH endonuclease, partial [Lachnospiraceae bacterium]
MQEEIVAQFKEWGPNQYNNNGELFTEKSISNYHSSLNTILTKLNLVGKSGFSKIYDCTDAGEFEELYFEIFENPLFSSINRKSNRTDSSALKLYRRFVRYLDALDNAPISEQTVKETIEEENKEASKLSDAELQNRVQNKGNALPKERRIIATNFIRDQEVAEYAVRRANGKCDLCLDGAPFMKRDNTPYLEAHHVEWLSRGGEDNINNVVAVCPNCHRML